MKSAQVISFDLRRQQPEAQPLAEPPMDAPEMAAPLVMPARPQLVAQGHPQSQPDPAPPRAPSRCDVAAVYAGLLGASVTAGDLEAHLARAGRADRPRLGDLARAFDAHGLSVRIVTRDPQDGFGDVWPALAEMTSGQIVLVLAARAGMVDIYDPTQPSQSAEIPAQDFARCQTGRVLVVREAFAAVAARHEVAARDPHWFWGEFRHYRRQMAEVAAGSTVANLLATAVALYSLQIYDRVIPNKSEPTLWVLTLGALLAVALDAALRIARSSLMDMTGKRIELAVQDSLMRRILGMKAAPSERRPSEIFSAVRDFGSVREFFTAGTIGTLADLPFLVIFLALVALIGGPVVWVLIAGGILMVVPGLIAQSRMVRLTAETQGASTRAAKLLYEAVFEHETLTTQRGEDRILRLWSELVTLSSVKSTDQRRITTWLTTWAASVQQGTYVLSVLIGTYLVFAGQFTVGTIIAIGILAGRTLGPLSQLSALLARWTQVKAALDGLDAIARARQSEDGSRGYLRRDRLSGSYALTDLRFSYDAGAMPTVDLPALAIPAGQKVALLGSNGSGKSTLLRLLAGIYEPGAGRLMLDGAEMSQIHPRDLRRSIGWLGQDVRLFSGTLRDNLNMTQLERDDDRLLAALDFAGLGGFVRSHRRGLDLPIREMGEGLSVGQRQSVGWARLWLQDPAIVLLDEPTAALDQTLESALVSRLGTWLAGRTAVIATHRQPILQLCDRMVILQSGRLAVDGPRAAVMAHLQGGTA